MTHAAAAAAALAATMLLPPPPPRRLSSKPRFSSSFLRSRQGISIRPLRTLPSAQKWRHRYSMFLSTTPAVKDGNLSVNEKDLLFGVPDNVAVTPLTDSAAFVGVTSNAMASRHVFKLGFIRDVRLMCLFRFKLWWMIPRIGVSGRDIPIETQMLLLEVKEVDADISPTYILFLPVLDGEFRSSLQGNSADELELCIESGDPSTVTAELKKAVLVSFGENPFELVKESMKLVQKQLGTFALRETKQMPGILDCFGWCTWDAFYQDVNPKGITDGLKSLSEGGTPAKFIIIDDGWQDTSNEFQKEGEPFIEGSQFGGRLVSIKENQKFRRKKEDEDLSNTPKDLKDFVSDIKERFGLKYVYVWHALLGYWGGLLPGAEATDKYNPKMRFPVQSPGNVANTRDIAMDCMEKYGIGTVDPTSAFQFYNDLHGYLVSQNVDGVKVDVQNVLETVAADLGGRVLLTKQFQQALEKSIAANFKDNSIICCMGQSTDSIYHCNQSVITRASDDYWPKNPTTQTLHIAAVAYNSIFLGEVVVPDWDMFYSRHDAAEFHAAARAVGGCSVYVSDKPGNHDFEILKKLVLSDGSVLRAKYPGRPSRDCLFNDPVMDQKSLLKIWNLNNCTGVLGVFNCQGAGTWPGMESTLQEGAGPELTGTVSPSDIEFLEEVTGDSWTGDFAVFSFKSGSLSRLSKQESISITLKVLHCDIFTVSPIKVYGKEVHFAPIGLLNMYNSGGAVEEVGPFDVTCGISIRGRGSGVFGAFSSVRPKSCTVNSREERFEYGEDNNLLTITIASTTTTTKWDILISY